MLAAVPKSDTVFPLVGRPHDSLPKNDARWELLLMCSEMKLMDV